MWTYVLTFLGSAVCPLWLAAYSANLAIVGFPSRSLKRRNALWCIWSLAIVGIVIFGVLEILAYRSDQTRNRGVQAFQTETSRRLQVLIDAPASVERTRAAQALQATLDSRPRVSPTVLPQAHRHTETQPISRLPPRNAENSTITDDSQLKLLGDAVTLRDSLQNWENVEEQKFEKDKAEMREDDVLTNKMSANSSTASAFIQQRFWHHHQWWEQSWQTEYKQLYAPEIIRIKREMTAAVPSVAGDFDFPDVNDPGNMGSITGMVDSLTRACEQYRAYLVLSGKIKAH